MGGGATFTVLRVGDGSAALTAAATPAFLEERKLDGSLVAAANNPLPLPTAASGTNAALTLSGTATSEGGISLSQDGQFIVVAGYDAAVGTMMVSSSASMTVNRIAGTVSSAGVIDTTTRLDNAFTGNSVRSAASIDGTSFWLTGNGGGMNGGVQYAVHGMTGSTQLITTPANTRVAHVIGGQLFADSATANFASVFSVGTGAPTMTGQTATLLPGLPTMTTSPYGFAILDTNPNVAGLDTIYLSDDRALASGGGISKWTFNGTTWSASAATFNMGLTTGVRGLTAFPTGNTVTIVATTTETSQNKIFVIVDDGTMNPTGTLVATAPQFEVFRGVALSPM